MLAGNAAKAALSAGTFAHELTPIKFRRRTAERNLQLGAADLEVALMTE